MVHGLNPAHGIGPLGRGGLRNGGTPACWRGSAHQGGWLEQCPAAHTTRSAPWSPRTGRAHGVSTDDGSDGEVQRDAQNEL
jgi:hypothetical protein